MTEPLPEVMEGLPKHGGLPVPWTVHWNGDVPDFRVIDQLKLMVALRDRLCAVCGKPMGYWIVFIGGPKSVESRYFLDGPMHEECARWSLANCPFLVGKLSTMSDPDKRPAEAPEGGHIVRDDTVPAERPERFGLYFTRGYTRTRDAAGRVYIRADKAKRIEWFG